jgi:hypothetical protein
LYKKRRSFKIPSHQFPFAKTFANCRPARFSLTHHESASSAYPQSHREGEESVDLMMRF